MNDGLLSSLLINGLTVGLAVFNLKLARDSYKRYGDARSLRGYVASWTMLGGAILAAALSPALRAAFPEYLPLIRALSGLGRTMILIGLSFSVWTWWRSRGA